MSTRTDRKGVPRRFRHKDSPSASEGLHGLAQRPPNGGGQMPAAAFQSVSPNTTELQPLQLAGEAEPDYNRRHSALEAVRIINDSVKASIELYYKRDLADACQRIASLLPQIQDKCSLRLQFLDYAKLFDARSGDHTAMWLIVEEDSHQPLLVDPTQGQFADSGSVQLQSKGEVRYVFSSLEDWRTYINTQYGLKYLGGIDHIDHSHQSEQWDPVFNSLGIKTSESENRNQSEISKRPAPKRPWWHRFVCK